jgi:amidase
MIQAPSQMALRPATRGGQVSDTALLTASQAVASLRAGQTTAVDVVEALLARIEKYNPAVNAIVTLDAAGARRRAQEADQASRRGEWWGPLHGLPITIKDSFETAGLRTVSGYPPFAQHVPQEDAPPVARLRQAGAILLGKTNLPTLASGIQTSNPVFGRTNNPWDLKRTPGGSSGGAAAAVSAGLSYLELGSDIGGSIRIPAHFCGIYGLKFTGGRVSGKGHLASPKRLIVPAGWEDLLQLAAFGPLARSIEDLRLALPILAEPTTPGLAPVSGRPLASLRIAWTDDFGGAALSADSRQQMHRLAAALAQAGCQIERVTAANFDYQAAWRVAGLCLGAINTLFQPPLTQWLRRLSAPILSRVGPREALMQGLMAGTALRAPQVREALERRAEIIEQLEQFLSQWDAWLCPVFPSAAFTHRASNAPLEVDDRQVPQLMANLLHSVIFNLTGHPVVAMPMGLSSQALPIGVQVVGRRWQEMALLEVAEQIATVTSGCQRPPGY